MGWIIKVIFLCFVVGVLLSVFDVDPASILTDTWATVAGIAAMGADVARWALPYILVGAVVVVPLAVLGLLLRWSRARWRS